MFPRLLLLRRLAFSCWAPVERANQLGSRSILVPVLAYQKKPSLLGEQVAALPKGAWVTIDEVQKLPALLEEVHAVLFDRSNDISEVGLLTSCLRDEWTNSQH